MHVKQRIIQLSVNNKLKPIEEIDESETDYFQTKNSKNSNDLYSDFASRLNLSFNHRVKSFDNLLLVDYLL